MSAGAPLSESSGERTKPSACTIRVFIGIENVRSHQTNYITITTINSNGGRVVALIIKRARSFFMRAAVFMDFRFRLYHNLTNGTSKRRYGWMHSRERVISNIFTLLNRWKHDDIRYASSFSSHLLVNTGSDHRLILLLPRYDVKFFLTEICLLKCTNI